MIFSLTFQCFHFLFVEYEDGRGGRDMKSFLGRSALSTHCAASNDSYE